MLYIKVIFFTAVFLFLQGCQTVPVENAVVMKANTIVVFPAESLHKELEKVGENVQLNLSKKIARKDFTVIRVSASEYQQLRKEALTVSGSMYDPSVGKLVPLNRNAFVKALIDLTAEKYSFEVIVVPEMLLRQTQTQGDQGVWDGVKRNFSWVEKPKEVYRLPPKGTGLSLRLGAYTYGGASIFVNYTGVSLPYDLLHNTTTGKFGFQLKEVFFTNKELDESTDIALTPFFKQVKFYAK